MLVRYIITGLSVLLGVVSSAQIAILSPHGPQTDTSGSISRIINGWNARKYEFPWQLILYYGQEYYCGAVLISASVALTAAHCVDSDVTQKWRSFTVVAGVHKLTDTSEAQSSTAKSIIMHPRYTRKYMRDDIAVIKLNTPLNITRSVKHIALSDYNFDTSSVSNRQCFTSGYGVTTQYPESFSDTLQKLRVNVIGNFKCKVRLRKFKNAFTNLRTVCTLNVNRAACYGDSGGPMGCYDRNGVFRLVGIVAWGPAESCVNGPSVYTRVSRYISWLRKYI